MPGCVQVNVLCEGVIYKVILPANQCSKVIAAHQLYMVRGYACPFSHLQFIGVYSFFLASLTV